MAGSSLRPKYDRYITGQGLGAKASGTLDPVAAQQNARIGGDTRGIGGNDEDGEEVLNWIYP